MFIAIEGHFLKIQGTRKLLKWTKTMDHDQGNATAGGSPATSSRIKSLFDPKR